MNSCNDPRGLKIYLVMQLLHRIVAVLDHPTEPDGSYFQHKVIINVHICLNRLPMANAFGLHLHTGNGTSRQPQRQRSLTHF